MQRVMKAKYEVAIVGTGFAGSLLARVLATLGNDVVLLERGIHPRFAIGESSTPLANLSLERIGLRYGFDDCYALAAHGRWLAKYPHLRRGLKRGFTFYRHHPGAQFENRGLESERLLVAASPDDSIADSHWFRADVDHQFVRAAIEAGVDYKDRIELNEASFSSGDARLSGSHDGAPFEVRAQFVIDASGPGGFLARQLSIPSGLDRTHTRAALVYSHFDGVRLMQEVVPDLPKGPYPDDWAAVHHVIDEGWMYSLRFDHGTTSAGFLLTPRGLANLQPNGEAEAARLWSQLLSRYPTIAALFENASPTMPIAFRPTIQHRLTHAVGERWALMPHTYAFVDPLFSTGIAWSLRAVERLALAFENTAGGSRLPNAGTLARYESLLAVEADQIDFVVAGAYESMASFDTFAAQAMLYFAAVSFAEANQRLRPDDSVAWRGFLGVGDEELEPLPAESLRRLRSIGDQSGAEGKPERRAFVSWIRDSIAPRNVAGLADQARHNLYPMDFAALVAAHDLLGLSREEMEASLPALRGMSSTAFGQKTRDYPGLRVSGAPDDWVRAQTSTHS
jgi:FADH2 O2-dependent halogenase